MEYFFITLGAIIAVLLVFFKSPKGKGIWGEFQVKLVLGKNKENKKYVINNLMILNEGKSSQIDHIIISKTGVFVIETKNYAGRIYGSEDQKEWTQALQYGKIKNKFYSPIMQNKTHIYVLSKVLERNDCFRSIIIFPRAQLMTKTTTDVGNIGTIRRVYKRQKEEILTQKEINSIHAKLIEYKKNPQISTRDHVRKIEEMKTNINNNICPRCGKELILKKGQYGEFYGCSGYPQCKFKKTNK